MRLKCRFPERAVNICASRHVDFWDLTRDETGATMCVFPEGYRRLREAARESGAFTVEPLRKRGAPFLLWRVRKRFVLLAGLALCLTAVWASSLFIWQIDVTGNRTVSSARILAELRKLGVGIGSSVFAVSQQRLSNEMLLRFPELCWITLNTHGSRIHVIVREAVPRPKIRDPDEAAQITARKSGVITSLLVLGGEPQVTVGDSVKEGDVLVSAVVPGGVDGIHFTHADAEIWASTIYEKSLCIPLAYTQKQYTGESHVRTALVFGGKRINLYFTGRNYTASCDKITSYDSLQIGGSVLPLTVVRERLEEYEEIRTELSSERAESILRARLLSLMGQELQGGYAIKTEFVTSQANGVLTVTLYAECVENIAVSAVLTPEEQTAARVPQNPEPSGGENA